MIFLIQLRVLQDIFAPRAHYWLMFHLISIKNSRSFSAKLLYSWSAPSCMGAQVSFYPGGVLSISLCWSSTHSCQIISPARETPTEQCHDHLVYQPLLPTLYHPQTGWGCVIIQFISENSSTAGPSIDPWATSLVTALQVDLCSWPQPSEPGSSHNFQSTWLFISVMSPSVCLEGCIGGAVSKAFLKSR